MTVAMTVRVDKDLKEHLSKLSELKKTPVNKLVRLALDRFVSAETQALQAELEASLAALKAYQAKDPGFENAIQKVVDAEVKSTSDPAEGTVVTDEDQSATTLLRGVLRA